LVLLYLCNVFKTEEIASIYFGLEVADRRYRYSAVVFWLLIGAPPIPPKAPVGMTRPDYAPGGSQNKITASFCNSPDFREKVRHFTQAGLVATLALRC
jgi:hypothetical protein